MSPRRGTTLRRRFLRLLPALAAAVAVWGVSAPAWGLGRGIFTEDEIVALRQSFRFRFEGAAEIDYFSPNRDFGTWSSGYLAFYGKAIPEITLFTQINGFNRPGNEFEKSSRAYLETVGALLAPVENFYANVSASFGSNSSFVPRDRFDLALGIQFPVSENFTWAINPGGYYSKYFPGDLAYGAYLGPSFFIGYWNCGGQVIFTRSEPENFSAYSYLLFTGYDVDGWHNTDFVISFGDANFLTDYLADPRKVHSDKFIEARVTHRQWIGVDWGLLAEFGYFVLLMKEVNMWDATLGAFVEF